MRQGPEVPTTGAAAQRPRPVHGNDEGSLAPQTTGLGSTQGTDTQGNLPIVPELVSDNRAGTQAGCWFKY